MKKRAFLTVLGVAAAFAAASAAAQQPGTVGRLSNLEGNVMVSQGDGMVAAAKDQRVAPGTRVLTLSGGRVTINYDTGCDISLKENQRFTVRVGECGALLAEVASIGPLVAAGAAAGAPAVALVPATAIAAGLGYGVYETFKNDPDRSVSPN